MERLEAYIRRVMEIAELPVNGEQAEELRAHLADSAAAYQREGLAAEDAAGRAITEFGEAEIVGRQLREVTPLPVSRREWVLWGALVLGCMAYTALCWKLDLQAKPPYWYLLFLPFVLGAGLLASAVRQPLLAALAPLTTILLMDTGLGLFSSFRTYDMVRTQLEHNPQLFWFSMARFPSIWSPRFFPVLLAILAVCLIVARLRHIPLFAVTADRALACTAQLLPLLSMTFGMIAWILAVGLGAAIWLYGRRRSTFVERHALQAAAVSLFFLALLYGVQKYYLHVWHTGTPTPFVVVSGWTVVRLAFAPVLLYAGLAALSGHDFRYPFARLLFRGRRFRHA